MVAHLAVAAAPGVAQAGYFHETHEIAVPAAEARVAEIAIRHRRRVVGRRGAQAVVEAVIGQELARQQAAIDRMHRFVGQPMQHDGRHHRAARHRTGGVEQPGRLGRRAMLHRPEPGPGRIGGANHHP
ncbi:hypothetical protein D3C72_1499860 [compost metagenome]